MTIALGYQGTETVCQLRRSGNKSFTEMKDSVWYSVGIGLLLRLGLLIYGQWQDATMAVKYTDIDYFVFTDAAEFVTKGESPYQRATYRYTPLLAWCLQPNITVTPTFGKLLFIFCDILAGYLIYLIVSRQGEKNQHTAVFCAEFWLLNPLPMTICSRGNADSIMAVLVLLSIHLMTLKGRECTTRNLVLSGAVYGLAVHTKIYPVTYALPIYLYLNEDYMGKKSTEKSWSMKIRRKLRCDIIPNKCRFHFIVASIGSFIVLTTTCYLRYGQDFLHETYLYHITRRDTRHNFSPYFYMYYLVGNDSTLSLALGLAAFIPQMALLVLVSFKFYGDLPFCCFLQTYIFVAFNKVCTSQYFLWYLSLLPLVLPRLMISNTEAGKLVVLWFLGQAVWLAPAYYLEFEGQNTFLLICLAGFIFFWINIWILHRIIALYRFVPSYKNGHRSSADDDQRQLYSATQLVLNIVMKSSSDQKTKKKQ